MSPGSDRVKTLPFVKVIESDSRMAHASPNSAVLYNGYDVVLVARRSDRMTWPYDPTEDAVAMTLFQRGVKAQFEAALPNQADAARWYTEALRRQKSFARAWLHLANARLQLDEMDRAEQVYRMLIDRVERRGEMRMTRPALGMVHFNLAFLLWTRSEQSQCDQRNRLLVEADEEFEKADLFSGRPDSADLVNWLIVNVGRNDLIGSRRTIARIKRYLAAGGAQAESAVREYANKYARQLGGIDLIG